MYAYNVVTSEEVARDYFSSLDAEGSAESVEVDLAAWFSYYSEGLPDFILPTFEEVLAVVQSYSNEKVKQ